MKNNLTIENVEYKFTYKEVNCVISDIPNIESNFNRKSYQSPLMIVEP